MICYRRTIKLTLFFCSTSSFIKHDSLQGNQNPFLNYSVESPIYPLNVFRKGLEQVTLFYFTLYLS